MQKLCEEKIEILIDLVREKPGIYSKGDKNYKKNDWKSKIWKEIASALNAEENDCKAAWRSLRDQFVRYMKDCKGTSGQAADEKKKYKYFERLLFLKESLEPRAHCSNYDAIDIFEETEQMTSFSCVQSSYSESVSNELTNTVPLPDISPTSSASTWESSGPSYAKKRKEEDTTQAFKDFLGQLLTQVSSNEPKEMDSTEQFFLNMAQTVKSYNLSVSQITKLKCDTLMFVTERLEELKNQSLFYD